jgi:hypothetical protein
MITSLIIDDFESHRHTELKFGPGLNVIHGTSHVGKSGALRALALVAYGEWDGGEDVKKNKNGSVRTGCQSCSVSVETDTGRVSVRRGSGINEWEVEDKVTGQKSALKSPGAGPVWEAQHVLGLETRDVAGVKVRLNWADQRDKHFVLDEVEGQSASPSLVAALFDEVAGLNGCEQLVRTIASDKSVAEKEVRQLSEKLEQTETELRSYEQLDKQLEYLRRAQDKVTQTQSMNRSLQSTMSLKEQIGVIDEDRTRWSKSLEQYADVDGLLTRLRVTEDRVSLCRDNNERVRSFRQLQTDLSRCDDETSRLRSRVITENEAEKRLDVIVLKTADTLKRLRSSAELSRESLRVKREQDDLVRRTPRNVAEVQLRVSSSAELLLSLDVAQRLGGMIIDNIDETNTVRQTMTKVDTEINELNDEKKILVDAVELCPVTSEPLPVECRKKLLGGR